MRQFQACQRGSRIGLSCDLKQPQGLGQIAPLGCELAEQHHQHRLRRQVLVRGAGQHLGHRRGFGVRAAFMVGKRGTRYRQEQTLVTAILRTLDQRCRASGIALAKRQHSRDRA